VLAIVNACTDDDGFEKSTKSEWLARKQLYLEHVRHADLATRRVSCADKLHNARCLLADYRQVGEAVWERFRTKSREDQVWCYTELARAFLETGTGPLAQELSRVVAGLCREGRPQPGGENGIGEGQHSPLERPGKAGTS
jgi:hypothetical protein